MAKRLQARCGGLGEGAELLLHEEARDLRVEALADHARVPAVGRAEGVVHVDVTKLAQALAELLHLDPPALLERASQL